MSAPTHLDLFSGIGGFALAAEWAGYETVQFCEIDPWCQKVLAKNFPGVPIHGDIRDLPTSALGRIDLLTGGFPCQPFSLAGKRRGNEDDRFLWPEMRRVIDEVRPRFVVAENVPGIISLALDDCLASLESLGYEAWAVVLPACAVSAPHRRDRVWIVADSECHRRNSGSGAERKHAVRAQSHREPSETQEQRGGFGIGVGKSGRALANPQSGAADCERSECTGGGVAYRGDPSGDSWRLEPGVGRVAHGLSNRVDRLRGLGNAIVPQVAYEILRLIPFIESEVAA